MGASMDASPAAVDRHRNPVQSSRLCLLFVRGALRQCVCLHTRRPLWGESLGAPFVQNLLKRAKVCIFYLGQAQGTHVTSNSPWFSAPATNKFRNKKPASGSVRLPCERLVAGGIFLYLPAELRQGAREHLVHTNTGSTLRRLKLRLPYARREASLILRGRCRSERPANRGGEERQGRCST